MSSTQLEKKRDKESEYMASHPTIQSEIPPPYTAQSFSSLSPFAAGPSALISKSPLHPPQLPTPRGSPPSTPSSLHLFPATFNIYESIFSRTRTIGEHKPTPLFCLTEHSRLRDPYHLVLHNGPTTASPRLAGIKQRSIRSTFDVSLCPPGPLSDGLTTTETLEKGPRSTTVGRFGFTIEVGRIRETFQWRTREGSGYILGNYRHWLLLRKAADRPPDGALEGWKCVRDFETYDGMEVVAAWDTRAIRGTKLATYRFLGTGASGLLGERWEVMAVATGGWICIKEMERSAAVAGAAGGSAVAV